MMLELIDKLEQENASLKRKSKMTSRLIPMEDLQGSHWDKSGARPKTSPSSSAKAETDITRQRAPIDHEIQVNVTVRKHSGHSQRTAMVKAATYDGNVSWSDYAAHFETCAEINGWSYTDKGLYLAVSLRGQAQGVFGNLSERSKDYDSLVTALEERFAPPNQTELYRVQLRERRQKASETLSELGQDIRRLTNMAYPSAPADLKDTLAKEQFLDSLVSIDMRLRIKQARPTNLNDAIRHAVELEAFNRAEKAKLTTQGLIGSADMAPKEPTEKKTMDPGLDRLQNTVDRLAKQLQQMQGEMRQSRRERSDNSSYGKGNNDRKYQNDNRACFNCGSKFHLRRNCPKLDRKPGENKKENQSANTGHDIKEEKGAANAVGTGLYIPVTWGGQSLNCLVDTGATLTVLSTRAWNNSSKNDHDLIAYDRTIVAAGGTPLIVKGKTCVSLTIGGNSYEVDAIVADIENDVMMGLDFMQRHKCTIDVVNNLLTIAGKEFGLNCSDSIGCYRVVVTTDIEVPAWSEMIIQGSVPNITKKGDDLFLVEPSERVMESGKGLIAKSLVKGCPTIPLRIMNSTDEPQKLFKGTLLANLSPVEETKRVYSADTAPKCLPAHLNDMYERTVVGMQLTQRREVARILTKYASVFSETDDDIGRTGIIRHRINTGDATPVKQPIRRTPVHLTPEVDKQIDEMLNKNVIQPSTSPWSSGIVLVTKKDGSKRFCIDYRKLNDATVKDSYPLPRIDDTLEQLAGAKWFSCLDLNSGYWQVEVQEEDRPKTAFNSRRGLYEFRVMPFGLCNAPATFERLMETVLAGLHWQICLIYLDDIIIHGHDFQSMLANLDSVLARLEEAGLKLKPKKCQLFCKEVTFLGHVISAEGVKTDPSKIQAVRDWAEPENVTQLRSFIGFCSYYRRFVRGFADIAKPLHKLTEKYQPYTWTEECGEAFRKLKETLCEATVLAHPDFTKEFILDTDASDYGIGAVLSQVIDGTERVVGFASKTLSKAERRYCVTRKELYALVHFVKYYRHYLVGKHFTVRTDHSSLQWLMRFKEPEGQVARWLEVLSSFDMKIEHRPGRKHQNADGMSRLSCKQCGLLKDGNQTPEVNQVTEHNTRPDLVNLQNSDHDICTVREWVKAGEMPEKKDLRRESYFIKALVGQWERLHIQNDVLVRCWDLKGTDMVIWQVIVPLASRREILRYSHDIKASGHLGVKKTLRRIRQGYYWPGMQNDVSIYVSGCEKCTRRKDPSRTKKAPMEIVRSGYPMERIAIDILGPLPRTEGGNQYIVVIGDYFTKWTESHAIPNIEARTVATVLIEQVVSRFGVPRTIHSDQGAQFEGKLFSEMCSLLQIEKTRTSPYHARSDGMVERFNKTLVSMLSAFVNEHHTDWDKQLQFVMMAYRSSEHETTGFTPNRCMLGREAATPLDLIYEMPSSIKSIPLNQWVWELQESLETTHSTVRQYTGQAMRRQKKYHDQKLSYETFEVGEKVYVYFPVKRVGCSSKLTSYWRGPYEVKEKLSNVLYRVNCARSGSIQVIHCDRMRKCKSQVLPGEDDIQEFQMEAEPDEAYDTPEYEVDFGSGKRVRRQPIWMKDYILSLSTFRSRDMAKTKITTRTQPICSKCLKVFPSQEDFAYHTKVCVLSAIGCGVCKKTFSTKKYHLQHIRRIHMQPDKTTTASPEKAANETVTKTVHKESESEAESDWDREPDIAVDQDSDSSEVAEDSVTEPMCDKEEGESFLMGRTIRKPTFPVKITPVIKKQVLESPQEERVRSRDETREDIPGAKSASSVITVNVVKRKVVSQEVKIEDAGELVYSVFSTVKGDNSRKEPELILGDYLPKGAMVSANDIRLRRVLNADGGNVSLIVKYKTQ